MQRNIRPSRGSVAGLTRVPPQDFLRSTSPDVFRLFCLRSSYRSGEPAAWPESLSSWDPETGETASAGVLPAP